jgi:hypothetical protein
MNRRSLLKSFAAIFVARPVVGLAGRAQTDSPAGPFAARDVVTLGAIAEVVLPSGLGVAGRRRAVDRFIAWFAKYRAGADMGHGYGAATLRAASGPSPITRYPPQFAAIDAAAVARGATTLAALPIAARLEVIEAFLNQPQPVNRLPTQPSGTNLVADFMGSYFSSQDAWDLCYQAEIRRDSCRTLDDSTKAPAPIRGR